MTWLTRFTSEQVFSNTCTNNMVQRSAFLRRPSLSPLLPRRNQVIGKPPSTGIERLIEAAKTGKTLTPDIVRKGDSTAKLAMMLADIYHEAREYEKSLDLCNRLLTSAAIKRATPEQRSYAYYKRARNTYLMMSDKSDPDPTIADYLAAVSAAPKAEWADESLFLAANVHWNSKQDVDAAIALWQRLLKEYPGSKEAPRSALYIGVARYWKQQYPEARKALAEFLARYPDSIHVPSARRLLARCEEEMNANAKSK